MMQRWKTRRDNHWNLHLCSEKKPLNKGLLKVLKELLSTFTLLPHEETYHFPGTAMEIFLLTLMHISSCISHEWLTLGLWFSHVFPLSKRIWNIKKLLIAFHNGNLRFKTMLQNFNNETLTNENNILYFQQWHKTVISANQKTQEL